MSKTHLLAEKYAMSNTSKPFISSINANTPIVTNHYNSSKDRHGEYIGSSDHIKGSISNSFIKKNSTQINQSTLPKSYQHTMPLNKNKRMAHIKETMDSSVALPKIEK